MSAPDASPLQRLLGRARRRLVLQTLAHALVVAWTAALALSAVAFLVDHYWPQPATEGLRWAVAGGLFALATVAAAVWTYRQSPSRLATALSLDERFGLRERVTTSLTLTDDQRASAAGQALLADVNERLGSLDVGSRFPLRFGWPAALVPAAAAGLALAAVFFPPVAPPNPASANAPAPLPPAAVEKIDQKSEAVARNLRKPKTKVPRSKETADDLEKLDLKDVEKILKQSTENEEQARDKMKKLTPYEKALEKEAQARAERMKTLEQQFEKLDELTRKERKEQPAGGQAEEDPVDRFQDALGKGDAEGARKEIDELEKKMKSGTMSKQEKEQLGKKMEEAKDRLERLSRQKEKEQKLDELEKQGKIDPETLQRERDELKKEKEKSKDLDKMARQIDRSRMALDQGDCEKAAEELEQLSKQLDDIKQEQQDQEDVENQLQRLQDAKSEMNKACQHPKPSRDGTGDEQDAERLTRDKGRGGEGDASERGGRKDQPGDGEMTRKNKSDQQANSGKPPRNSPAVKGGQGGRREEAKTGPETNAQDARTRTQFDKAGQTRYIGAVPGGGVNRDEPNTMTAGEVRQASQAASETLDVQTIEPSKRKIAKGYFQKLNEQVEKKP
jgi:hypothetical protein